MNVALRVPTMSREAFLDWAEAQEGRWEFDGFEPVAMTGGTARHSQLTVNIHLALGPRLRGTGCRTLGPDAGVATVGDAVRYPDALVTCARFSPEARVIPGVVVVFEVLSQSSGRHDRITKLREYAAVPSIRRYVIVEVLGVGLTVHERTGPDAPWTTTVLAEGEVLALPEVGAEVPVAEIYDGVEFSGEAGG